MWHMHHTLENTSWKVARSEFYWRSLFILLSWQTLGSLWPYNLFTFLLTFHTVNIFLIPKLYLRMLKWQTLPPRTHWFHFMTLPFLGRVCGQRRPCTASSTFWSVVLNFLCTWRAFKNPDILALNQNHLEWGPDI